MNMRVIWTIKGVAKGVVQDRANFIAQIFESIVINNFLFQEVFCPTIFCNTTRLPASNFSSQQRPCCNSVYVLQITINER